MIKNKILIGVILSLIIVLSAVSPVIAATTQDPQQTVDVAEDQPVEMTDPLAELETKFTQLLQNVDLKLREGGILKRQVSNLKDNASVTVEQLSTYLVLLSNRKDALGKLQDELTAICDEYDLIIQQDGTDPDILDRVEAAVQQLDQVQVQLRKEQYALQLNKYGLIIQLDALKASQEEFFRPEINGSDNSFQQNGNFQVDSDSSETVAWIVPVKNYYLSSPFGMRTHPILGYQRMHNGVDMACATGTEIYATRPGKVLKAQWSDSAGYYVQIDHGDGFVTEYMHMTKYIVAAGDQVSASQVIGYVGSTGLSDGPHLHFGVSYKGNYVDPLKYIN